MSLARDIVNDSLICLLALVCSLVFLVQSASVSLAVRSRVTVRTQSGSTVCRAKSWLGLSCSSAQPSSSSSSAIDLLLPLISSNRPPPSLVTSIILCEIPGSLLCGLPFIFHLLRLTRPRIWSWMSQSVCDIFQHLHEDLIGNQKVDIVLAGTLISFRCNFFVCKRVLNLFGSINRCDCCD